MNTSEHGYMNLDISNRDNIQDTSVISDNETNDFIPDKQLQEVRRKYKDGVIIAHLNINSIRNKIGEVQDLLYKQLLDIYCISETKIDESFPQGQFNVPNYTAYRNDRTATVYRHPNGLNQRQEQCFKHLSEFMDKALVEYEFCLLMGDFNINVKQSRDNKNEVLYNFMDNYDMKNLIKHDTCHKSSEGTIIDLLITNDKSKFISAGTIANGTSDFHEIIYGVLSAKFKHK